MQEVDTCSRHDGRRAGVRCQRCERPICPDCMRQASVGFHCPECAGGNRSQVMTGAQVLRRHETPIVTNVLIALNVAAFLALVVSGGGLFQETFSWIEVDFAIIGSIGVVDGSLTTFAVVPTGVGENIGVAWGEWYRLVTGAFLHGSPIHLGMNMYALYILGPQLERALGKVEFIGVYGVALLAGSFGALLMDPFVPTVGASGAIYGLFGAAVILQKRMGINPWQSGIVGLILINVLFTFAIPGISIGGHLGGLLGGFMAAYVVLEATVRRQPVLAYVGCAALAVGFALAGVWAAEQALQTLTPVLDFGFA
jgi:membrane associated rhomboid family serine protease